MTWAANHDAVDALWRVALFGERLEGILIHELGNADLDETQGTYRGLMEMVAELEPLDLDELLTGYNDAPEGLSGGAA